MHIRIGFKKGCSYITLKKKERKSQWQGLPPEISYLDQEVQCTRNTRPKEGIEDRWTTS